MPGQELLQGAYNLAKTAHMSGMFRGDVVALVGGLIGTALLFYGSQRLPEIWRIEDSSPVEYISPQIEALRQQVLTPIRTLL